MRVFSAPYTENRLGGITTVIECAKTTLKAVSIIHISTEIICFIAEMSPEPAAGCKKINLETKISIWCETLS